MKGLSQQGLDLNLMLLHSSVKPKPLLNLFVNTGPCQEV